MNQNVTALFAIPGFEVCSTEMIDGEWYVGLQTPGIPSASSRRAPGARSARSAPPAAPVAHLRVHEHEALLRAARRQAETPGFREVYRRHRPMVERSIAWLTRGNRRVRYRGVSKNDHWPHHRIAALNLRRLLVLGLTRSKGTWVIGVT